MSMVVSYERTGRTRQKERTRAALVAGARKLLSEGRTPSVEEVAEVAGISRATAYRYFPNRHALVAAAHPETEAPNLLGDGAPAEPRARLERTLDELIAITLDTEHELRAMLRVSLEPDSPEDLVLRKGRAIKWLEEALAPLRETLGPTELRRLALAIRSACGIESLVWLTDVGGVSRKEAGRIMRSSALAIFDAGVVERR
jgi:AcrR family transcriptional regulator